MNTKIDKDRVLHAVGTFAGRVQDLTDKGLDKLFLTAEKVTAKSEFISELVTAEKQLKDNQPGLYAELPDILFLLGEIKAGPGALKEELQQLKKKYNLY